VGKIILDTRLPSELVTQKTTWGNNDLATIQADGESALSNIKLGDLIGSEIPAALGAFAFAGSALALSRADHVHALPNAIEAVTAAIAENGSLTASMDDQVSLTVSASSSVQVLVMCLFEGYATRTSGIGAYGVQVAVRQGTTAISPMLYPCYASVGGGSITIPAGDIGSGLPSTEKTYTVSPASHTIGGSVFWWDVLTISEDTTFTIRAAYILGSTSGARNSARIQAFKLLMA
jgi:hypothetical protein